MFIERLDFAFLMLSVLVRVPLVCSSFLIKFFGPLFLGDYGPDFILATFSRGYFLGILMWRFMKDFRSEIWYLRNVVLVIIVNY